MEIIVYEVFIRRSHNVVEFCHNLELQRAGEGGCIEIYDLRPNKYLRSIYLNFK